MAKELNEDSGFKVSIKTLLGIGAAMATVISMWFMLRQTIMTTQEDVKEIKKQLEKLNDKIDRLR